jgi:Family of unknown function (DUF6516)
MDAEEEHELEFLLSLDGYEFRFASGYRVRFAARRVPATKHRPHGIKYSLTLHTPGGERLYGLDNAHKIRRRREFDHRHVYGARKLVATRTAVQPGCWRISTARWSGFCQSEVTHEA